MRDSKGQRGTARDREGQRGDSVASFPLSPSPIKKINTALKASPPPSATALYCPLPSATIRTDQHRTLAERCGMMRKGAECEGHGGVFGAGRGMLPYMPLNFSRGYRGSPLRPPTVPYCPLRPPTVPYGRDFSLPVQRTALWGLYAYIMSNSCM